MIDGMPSTQMALGSGMYEPLDARTPLPIKIVNDIEEKVLEAKGEGKSCVTGSAVAEERRRVCVNGCA